MTARIATIEDIPALVEMGRRFLAMSPHKPMGPYDGEAIVRVLTMLIDHPDGLVMTNDEGVIGGIIAPVYFSPSVRQMDEHFWWANGGGKGLLKAFEEEAAKMGADFLMLSTLENARTKVIDRVVTRKGYLPVERRYAKDLR